MTPCWLFTSQNNNTNDFRITIFPHKEPSPASDLTTTTQVDTGNNNDDNTQFFAIYMKHNHSNLEIPETTTTTTPVQATVYSRLCQISSLT